jgi:uncharacterized RDD family membrane protein YckC
MTPNATRIKLFAACVYELLLLIALWMLFTWIFVRVFGDATGGYKRYVLQLVLWLATGAYFVWCWCKSGQTLAAQTWKIKLVTQDSANQDLANQENNTLSPKQAVIRYALASACLLACGAGYLWALIDKNGLFLHDRLLKTRFIQLK